MNKNPNFFPLFSLLYNTTLTSQSSYPKSIIQHRKTLKKGQGVRGQFSEHHTISHSLIRILAAFLLHPFLSL